MGAPVGEPALVIIPDELVRNEPEMHDIAPGVSHGTLFIRDTTDRSWLIHTDKSYNRERFALLAVLYGWLCAQDNQLIYSNHEPHYVYSVDHGHFLPGGPEWTIASLARAPIAQPLQDIRGGCGLSDEAIAAALAALRTVTMNDVIRSVAFPPDEWGVSMAERAAIACFIRKRRIEMLKKGFVWKGARP